MGTGKKLEIGGNRTFRHVRSGHVNENSGFDDSAAALEAACHPLRIPGVPEIEGERWSSLTAD